MLIEEGRNTLAKVLNWHMAAMKGGFIAPGDADCFPSVIIMDAVFRDDHWAIRNAFDSLEGWLSRNAGLTAQINEQTGMSLLPVTISAAKERFSGLFLAWEDSGDGAVKSIPMDAAATGRRRFHSLGDAAMNGGVAISVFDKPIKAIDVYNGTDALRVGASGLKNLIPVGKVSQYKVAILDGKIVHPPAWPSELLRDMTDRTAKPDSEDPEP